MSRKSAISKDNLIRSDLCDSHREEVASMLTHSAGVAFSVAALITMLWLSGSNGLKLISSSVFGCALILLYSSSSLYHFANSVRWKSKWQAFDHACIYLLIAGTYTPLTLITLRGATGWCLFGFVWALASVGVWLKITSKRKRDHWISTLLYLLMGWLILLVLSPLIRQMPAPGIWWLVAGGLCYSSGIVFYSWNKLLYNHAIWHLFVLGGSICHFMTIAWYVIS